MLHFKMKTEAKKITDRTELFIVHRLEKNKAIPVIVLTSIYQHERSFCGGGDQRLHGQTA